MNINKCALGPKTYFYLLAYFRIAAVVELMNTGDAYIFNLRDVHTNVYVYMLGFTNRALYTRGLLVMWCGAFISDVARKSQPYKQDIDKSN